MPGRLVVCGCVALPISGDDLAIPALVGLFFRSMAAIIAAVLLAIAMTQQTCPVDAIDTVFLVGTLVISTVTCLLYVALYRVTSAGSMLEWEPRNRKTVPLFHTLAVAYTLEVAIGALGIAILATTSCPEKTSLWNVHVVIVLAICFDFVILGLVLGSLIYLTRGKKPQSLDENAYQKTVAGLLRRMACCCCGLFGTLDSPMGNQELAWSEISRIVHAFLKDVLVDFTVPDIFAAFVLLRAEQRAAEKDRVERALSSSPSVSVTKSPNMVRFKSQSFTASTPITGSDKRAVEAMKMFHEFAPYMLGIYGWKLQFYMNPLTFLCKFPVAVARRMIYGNNVEHHVFRSIIGADARKRKIVYSSFTSYLGEAVPYTITVDHERKAVVITLRGTMSVGDIATDLLCTPTRLDMAARQWGVKDGDKHYTHGGMLLVANRIRTDIEKQQILHRLLRVKSETLEEQQARESHRTDTTDALTAEDRETFLKAMGKGKNEPLPEGLMYSTEVFINDRELSNLDCSGYRLICCGHSLGSCMAAILSLLLRPRFPQVKCLAYSCVSAIFSRELAEESGEWITSCTAGKDMFGRLSWHSAKQLRDQLLDVVRRSKASKAKILLSVLSRKSVRVDDLLYRPEETPDDLIRKDIMQRIERLKNSQDHTLDQVRMFMPGRIIYLEKMHTEIRPGWIMSRARSEYHPVWIEDRAQLQEIQISSRLILDHMPQYIMKIMDSALDRELVRHVNGQKRAVNGSIAEGKEEFLAPPGDLNV